MLARLTVLMVRVRVRAVARKQRNIAVFCAGKEHGLGVWRWTKTGAETPMRELWPK